MHISIARGVKIELVRVPAGEFIMGSDMEDEETYDDERPSHHVFVGEFLMGKFPVTVEQFGIFVSKSGYEKPASKLSRVHNHPVRQVNWFDAQAFCKWASRVTQHTVRMPSEAEWEKAARGTDGRLWPWGNWQPKSNLGNFRMFRTLMTGSYPTPGPSQSIRGSSASDTTPVGRYSPEADSPYGCCDMAGNVWQWTNSLHRPYPYRDDDGRETDRDLGMRVVRGGSFLSHFRRVRCTSRLRQPPENRVAPDLGFRICLSVP
jgi:formylglycine-generating enzyme required for sulfatase activity